MTAKKYRKRAIVVEAIQYTGENKREIRAFAGESYCEITRAYSEPYKPAIITREGNLMISAGDYVIRGVHGEIYPCKPEVFAAIYDEESENAGGGD